MKINVEVFKGELYDGDWPPEDAAGYLKWFKDKLDSIPEEHRGSANIELDSQSGYEGCHYASIEITYERPETEHEINARELSNNARIESIKARELKQLEDLKLKYNK